MRPESRRQLLISTSLLLMALACGTTAMVFDAPAWVRGTAGVIVVLAGVGQFRTALLLFREAPAQR